MLRLDNPFSPLLNNSLCCFEFDVDPQSLGQIRWELSQFPISVAPRERGFRLELPHSEIDAFGGLWISSEFLDAQDRLSLIERPYWQGRIGEYEYSQWVVRRDHRRSDRSESQIMIERLLPILEKNAIDPIALPVRLDLDLVLDKENFRGNSFAIVQCRLDDLKTAVVLSKNDWFLFLQNLAERTLKLVSRRGAKALEAPLLISLVGDLDRLGWVSPEIEPLSFRMIPTPASLFATNLVLWSRGPHQAIVVCGRQLDQKPWIEEMISLLGEGS